MASRCPPLQISTGKVMLLSADSLGSGTSVSSSSMVADDSAFDGAFCAPAFSVMNSDATMHATSTRMAQREGNTRLAGKLSRLIEVLLRRLAAPTNAHSA